MKIQEAKEAVRAQYATVEEKRKEWFTSLQPGALKEINRLRALKDKDRIRNPYSEKKPETPFFV